MNSDGRRKDWTGGCYVGRPPSEAEVIAGIEEGLAAMRAGDTIPHEQAMEELRAVIDRVAAR